MTLAVTLAATERMAAVAAPVVGQAGSRSMRLPGMGWRLPPTSGAKGS